MQNVLTAPEEPKYRRLRLGNARIAALVEAAPGARQAIEALGWVASRDDDGGAILELPLNASLEPIATVVQAFPGAPEASSTVAAANVGEPWTVTVLRGPLRTKLELRSRANLAVLAEAIEHNAALGRIPRERQRLLVGYPPRPLVEQREDGSLATLEELDLRAVMLQDIWEDLCEELRNGRASFVQIAQALARPAIAALGFCESRNFLADRALARLRSHTLRMPVEEVQMARRLFQLLGKIPGDPATCTERLTFSAECAAATALRGTRAPAGGDTIGDDDSSDEGEPLELVVERSSILESSMPQIRGAAARELRQPLEVRFANEAAEDAGGPRREFFNEFGRAAAGAHGLWRLTPAGSLVPTSTAVSSSQAPDPQQRHDFYRTCGRVFGMALHHTSRPPCHPMLVGLPLAQNFVRALQGDEPQTLEELQSELNAEQHENAPDFRGAAAFRTSSLRDLGLEGQLTFCYQDINGSVVDLMPSGRTVAVTDDTKETWLNLTLRYMLVESIREAVDSFRVGVCEVLGGAHLVLLGARELSEMWSGRGVITDRDLTVWRSKTEISPAITTQAEWFFELLSDDLSKARGRVLKFATGSDRWPVDTSAFTFTIEPMDGGDNALPMAMTCGNMLQLPRYSHPGSLRERLLKAVDLGSGLQRT